MIVVALSQLSDECTSWKNTLRRYRQEFTAQKNKLIAHIKTGLSRELLEQVDYFHNQLYIQLINIHDLKQSIKLHERQLDQYHAQQGRIKRDALALHEKLGQDYQQLLSILSPIEEQFSRFLLLVK